MLRDTQTPPLRSSTLRRATVIALTLAAGVFVAGLKPPERQQAMAQQDRPVPPDLAQSQAADENGFDLRYVPGTTKLLIGVRPASLHQRLGNHPLLQMLEEATEADKTGIHLKDIDQMLFLIHRGPVSFEAGEQLFRGSVIYLRMKQPTDFAQYAETVGFWTIDDTIDHAVTIDPPHILTEDERSKLRATEAIVQAHWMNLQELGDEGGSYQADERTIIWGTGEDVASFFVDQFQADAEPPDWKERFESNADSDLCIIWDTAAFRPVIQQMFNEQPNPFVGMFAPLWQKTELVIGSAAMDGRLRLTVNGWAADADDAARLEKTLTSLVPFATGLLETAKASAKNAPPEMQAMLQQSFGLAESALDNFKVETTDDRVTVTVEGDAGSVATLAAAMLPAVTQAREAARRTQSRNNLKQIGLAFHNFHDVYGHFPPPVLYGKVGDGKSKHPHSWRVAILPFVGGSDLYDRYKFDEPWDSEHNLKIAEQMPAVFRSPNDDPTSTNAAYYVLVGENTAVGAKREPDGQPTKGVPMRDIPDGTSNTLLVVEANRDIPWTKPEDIPYSPDEDLPKLGGWYDGGFHTTFVDGSVRFIADAVADDLIRGLIIRDDGQPEFKWQDRLTPQK